jgi:asparagine synthetase B (glutamine-hydrolysing)
VSAHTRWASVGDITEANCHPLDNTPTDTKIEKTGIIHVCLNGDIDNYLELKTEYEALYDKIHPEINTDTKLIPLQIQHHLKQGAQIEEAFRLAVNDFEGSHAISMHTDLAPGRLFLAQKGSGQAIFVGIAPDHYIAASELYGIVEQTPWYIKLNGGESGQIVVSWTRKPAAVFQVSGLFVTTAMPWTSQKRICAKARSLPGTSTARGFPIISSKRSVKPLIQWKKPWKTNFRKTRIPVCTKPGSVTMSSPGPCIMTWFQVKSEKYFSSARALQAWRPGAVPTC